MLVWRKKLRTKTVLAVTFLLLAVSLPVPSTRILASDQNKDAVLVDKAVTGNNQFAWELYQKIKADPANKDKNIFFSPYSLSTALAMTYAGSRGDTEKQMAQVLHFTLPQSELHQAFANLNGRLGKTDGKAYQLNVANALWGQQGYHFEADFLGLIGKYYNSGFQSVDYAGQPQKSVDAINQWVASNTADKIKDLLYLEDIDALTRLVLTNAIYFKGDWEKQFKPEETKDGLFKVNPGTTANVPMMCQNETEFRYTDSGNAQILELPYAGKDLAMLVILPKNDLNGLEAGLTAEQILQWRRQLATRKVTVFLPKFKFGARYYLDQILPTMGMADAFSDRADFSGITGNKGLYIKHVIHQAVIDVNEQGSEAAAATAVVMNAKSMNFNPIFIADHPFLFAIIHQPTGSVLFLGRVSNPTQP